MPSHLLYLTVAGIVTAGLLTGILLAFSIVVMRALRELPPATGMLVMQRINVLILNPLFLFLFLGSALTSLGVAVVAALHLATPGSTLLLSGAVAYLLGPLLTTITRNVPLNDRLARLQPDEAAAWPAWVSAWLRWNHFRTLLGAAGTTLMTLGLAGALGAP